AVDGDDGVPPINGRVPAEKCSVLGGEQEAAGPRRSCFHYRKPGRGRVESRAGGRADGRWPGGCGPWNRDDQLVLRSRLGIVGAIVERRDPARVAPPPYRQPRARGSAPSITQVRVRMRRETWDV